jgi:membrane-associated phospholipid phosphatase
MHEYLTYLNSPHLVANFQKTFGIESHFDSNNSSAKIDNNHGHQSTKHSKINGIESLETKKRIGKSKQRVSSSGHLNYSSNESTSTLTQTETITIKQDENDTEEPEKTSKHKRTLSGPKKFVNDTDHSHIIAQTTIHSQFWYYMFLLGASMGNEIFYCLFFPFWFWNVDGAIARKVGFLWGIFMYFGQATKDLLCMPRPASPPVVKLEERYKAEYGFPSTHAMVSAGLPLSLVVLSYSRYNINLPISILIASVFCCWVCCSRLYLGMHSLLDVIAGVLY